MSGFGSLSASVYNLNENVFCGRTENYYFRSCTNLPLLDIKFWTAENILALFCTGSMFAPLTKISARCFFLALVSVGEMVIRKSPPSISLPQVISCWRAMAK